MNNSETRDFVAYEYLSINTSSDKEALYIDCYENFGWKLTNNAIGNGLIDQDDYYINNANIHSKNIINLKFKRDRKIPNKAQIINLQKRCENSLKTLSKLEKEPEIKASFWAVVISVIGTIFMAISVFAIIATNPLYLLSIITGIVGLVFWIISYPVYRKVRLNKEEFNITPIEEQYNMIYDACEQAQKLLN